MPAKPGVVEVAQWASWPPRQSCLVNGGLLLGVFREICLNYIGSFSAFCDLFLMLGIRFVYDRSASLSASD